MMKSGTMLSSLAAMAMLRPRMVNALGRRERGATIKASVTGSGAPSNGSREMARRVRQMERAKAKRDGAGG